MTRYAEASADVMYKDFFWVFICQRITEANEKILKLPRYFIANVFSI